MTKLPIIALALMAALNAQGRTRQNIDADWRFLLADSTMMSSPRYDDSDWRTLNLPHDWSIEGDFLASAPAGNGGGALAGGVAWYRKHLIVTDADHSKRWFLDFDGVYMNSSVYVNGQLLGQRPYGYSSFRYDITPNLYTDGRDNVIAVRVDNGKQPNSRWYSGSGIYRHVWLVSTAPVAIAHWGTFVETTIAKNGKAIVNVSTTLENSTSQKQTAVVRHTLLDINGKAVASSSSQITLPPNTKGVYTAETDGTDNLPVSRQKMQFAKPHLWNVNDPYTYKVHTEVVVDGNVVDSYDTPTAARSFRFDHAQGFFLNGKPMKINGVCHHHDMGALGTAVNEDALYRQLKKLKDMGVNSIRCTHNPPAPELLAMCDTMGFIVQDEAFDMWRRKKSTYDYAQYFDKWWRRDLTDLIRRDRNHPSVMMWSIGNEVLEQWSDASADTLTLEQANLILNAGHDASTLAHGDSLTVQSLLTRELAATVKSLDTSRPVTAGCNEPDPGNHLFKSGALDIIGFNYHHQWVADVPKNFPGKPFMFSESVSALATRGHYRMPADSIRQAPNAWWKPYTDPSYQCSAYDNDHVPWGSTHETTWDVVKHTPWCAGQYIWTGWDYIGEPTPYSFPAHTSYFGIIDLAGFPKDSYYMYQSEWTKKDVLHLFPHWNWLPGQQVDLWCYYNNADEVELYLNGKSQGIRRKADSHQYHVAWKVPFEPGILEVISRKNGKEVARRNIKTAGQPHHLQLSVDTSTSLSDTSRTSWSQGSPLAFVTVEVVDKDGNVCPRASNEIHFYVEGAATIVGVDNGAQWTTERYKADRRNALNGKALVILQSTGNGNVTLHAETYDLPQSTISLTAKK